MCHACYVEYGSPTLDTTAIRAVAPLADVVYAFSCVGGNLHIVLDDWNLEDENLEFCQQCLDRKGLPDPSWPGSAFDRREETAPDQLAAEQACLDALKALTIEERASAMAYFDGVWGDYARATP
jgi:hypothetical protein